MGKRRRGRETALKLLFQIDIGKLPAEEVLARALEEGKADAEAVSFAHELVRGTLDNLREIDGLISRYAKDWTLERMANVDRNVLRLALFELLYLPDIPASVSVDEAVELAKRYSTSESGKFVNGILGNVVRDYCPAEARAGRG